MFTLLIGWFGSTPRQLAPFVALHQGDGDRTYVARYNGFDGFFRLDRLYADSEAEAARILAAAGRDDLVVHAFSDAGFTYLCLLVQALRRTREGKDLLGRIRGIVFDCAPGLYATLHPTHRAEFSRRFACTMTRFVTRRLRRSRSRYQPLLMAAFTRCLDLYQRLWPRNVRALQSAFDRIADDYPECPHLFLYAAHDPITPAADVTAFASRLESRGVEVRTARFDTAVHVGCYRTAPAEYRGAVAELLRSVRTRRAARPRGGHDPAQTFCLNP